MTTEILTDVTSRLRMPSHREARDSRDMAMLFFDDDLMDILPSGLYSLKGAICFPVTVMSPEGADCLGACLAIITHIESQRSVVLGECLWRDINHIFGNQVAGIGSPGVLEAANRGLHEFMSRMAADLGIQSYYYASDFETSVRWLQEIKNCKSLIVKPRLIESAAMSEAESLAMVFSHIAAGKLAYKLNGEVWRALAVHAGHASGGSAGKAPTSPVLLALCAAIRSIVAWPARMQGPTI